MEFWRTAHGIGRKAKGNENTAQGIGRKALEIRLKANGIR